MNKKLSWQEIEQRFDRQWVELIDYDWPEGNPYPEAGVVRVHADNRKEFYARAKVNPPKDSAILFVGKRRLPPHQTLCSSLMSIEDVEN